jgi:hypothetical protein
MKNMNIVGNIFGSVSGIPQLILGITYLKGGNYAEGAAKIAEGIGLFIMGYCIGKPIA